MTLHLKLSERRPLVHVDWKGPGTARIIERPRYAEGDIVAVGDGLYTVLSSDGVEDLITAKRAGWIARLLPAFVTDLVQGQVVASIEPLRLWNDAPSPPPWNEHKIARVTMPVLPPALPAFTCSGDTKHQTYKHDIKAGEWLRTLHGTIGKTEEDIFLGHVLDAALLAFSTLTPAEQRAYVMRAQGLTAGLTAAVKPLNTAV